MKTEKLVIITELYKSQSQVINYHNYIKYDEKWC